MTNNRKEPSVLQGRELATWKTMESDWAAIKRRPGLESAQTRAVRFFGALLDDQRSQSAEVQPWTPGIYAHVYSEFARPFGFSHAFKSLSRSERKSALLDLGYCAFKALRHRTPTGRMASREWELLVQDHLEAMDMESTRQETLLDVLESDLHATYRFWACKGAQPVDWTVPDIREHVLQLLPAQEHARFPTLVWSDNADATDNGKANMAVVQLYCPTLYTVLAALAPEDTWVNRKRMLGFAAPFMQPPQESACLALPLDLDGLHPS